MPELRGAPPRLPLAERLRPEHLDDLVGNPRARAELKVWAERWRSDGPPAQRAAVLSGPPGVGKTTAALAVAADFGWSLVEMNASDARNEAAINQVAGRASITHTLTEGPARENRSRALILLDEADCLTGRLSETARATPEPVSLREYLRGRYATIETLNVAWALGASGRTKPFASWEDVPRSPGHAGWARLPAARTDLEEWRRSDRPRDLSDRGGLGAIARLVRSTRQPLVLTVNDDRSLTRYSPIFRTGVARIRFYPIRDPEMIGRLEGIVRSERLSLADGAVNAIVRRAHGDLRAALNDLDAIAPIPAGPLQLTVLGTRDVTADFALFTSEILASSRFYRSGEVRDRIDATPDDLLPWVEENIPRFAPDAVHRDEAFRTLAVAERLLARARRWRVYGLWSYASELLTGGVSLSLHDAPVPMGYGAAFPHFLSEMGRSRSVRGLRDGLIAKVGGRFHLSHRKTRELLLPFLEGIFLEARGRRTGEASRRTARAIVRELDLTPDEVGYLLDREIDSPAVRDLFAADDAPSPVSPRSGRHPKHPVDGEATPKNDSDASRVAVQRSLSDFGSG